ncbi:aspartic proteinase 39 isoform X2 [Tripterygium wilfordii]|uniref:aspartic proteinase 39 isoform X2 n=1 Tax=Tripterygium wilfordii TaxID=458696 RepID=UPI0018F837E5|nr:aspartic proteinase 39 isoform X2 [Tripterygium wilfordii]
MRLYDDLLTNGYYTTRLWIGNPPQEFALIVDTGSTVTYVPCSGCEQCGKHQDPMFQPELSTTYQAVKCNPSCNCDNEGKQCTYERRYAEMSSSSGVLAEDVISFGNESELTPQRAAFGCENMETGDLYSQRADGIMGLGRGQLSVVDQLVDKGVISDSFSLCYGGMDVGGGAMVLGGISPPHDMAFTRSDPFRSPYYNIELKELHVAGKPLKLSPRIFDGKHGTVLDSGTTYAYFPEDAFIAFKSAHTKVSGGYCLGIFQNGKDPTTLLGGIVVRNTLVTYDRENNKIGFWKTNCSELWRRLQIPGGPAPAPSVSPSSNGSIRMPPSPLPSGSPPDILPDDFRIGMITFDMSITVNNISPKPNFTELAEFIAHEMEIDELQVHLLNFSLKENAYLVRWAIFPPESARYISNSMAMSIVLQLKEHRLQFPERFGSYQLLEWNVEPRREQTWWKQHFLAVAVGVLVTLVVGMSIMGVWLVWRHRQRTVGTYEPVGAATIPEHELQPL